VAAPAALGTVLGATVAELEASVLVGSRVELLSEVLLEFLLEVVPLENLVNMVELLRCVVEATNVELTGAVMVELCCLVLVTEAVEYRCDAVLEALEVLEPEAVEDLSIEEVSEAEAEAEEEDGGVLDEMASKGV
jgi:hypothetical protein